MTGRRRSAPSIDDCARIAAAQSVPLREVYEAAQAAYSSRARIHRRPRWPSTSTIEPLEVPARRLFGEGLRPRRWPESKEG